jgi:hypothetical protein
LPLGALTRRPAIALLAGRGAPQPRQIAISLFGNSSVPRGWSRQIKATEWFWFLVSKLFMRPLYFNLDVAQLGPELLKTTQLSDSFGLLVYGF